MRGTRPVVVALVVVLAGCAGAFGGSDSTTSSPTATVTSTPGATATPTPEITPTPEPTVEPTATATPDPHPDISEARLQEYRNFTEAVERQALRPVKEWTFVDDTTVRARLPSAEPYEQHYDRSNETFVEAVAYTMAQTEATPRRVVVETENSRGEVGVVYHFNRSIALELANFNLTAGEFVEVTKENVEFVDKNNENITYVVEHSIEEVRKWYASAYRHNLSLEYVSVERVNTTEENVTIELVNNTYTDIPIVLTVQTPQDMDNDSTEVNEWFETDRSIAEAWYRTVIDGSYGTEPQLLRIRYVNREDELFRVQTIPTAAIQAWIEGDISKVEYVFLTEVHTESHNGGVDY
jgi:hypothetical protein